MPTIELGIYEHFKGMRYEVIGLSRHSETLEELVIYKALYVSEEFGEGSLWVRPKDMFFEKIIRKGTEVDRFRFIGSSDHKK